MCFSLEWLKHILIQLVVLGGVIAIIKTLVPYLLSILGAAGGVISQIINIILWVIAAVLIIIIVFGLLECLFGMAGSLFSVGPFH